MLLIAFATFRAPGAGQVVSQPRTPRSGSRCRGSRGFTQDISPIASVLDVPSTTSVIRTPGSGPRFGLGLAPRRRSEGSLLGEAAITRRQVVVDTPDSWQDSCPEPMTPW